jgi:prepilin-type N-terminal cleavage/methylation domain-containing protein
MEQKLKKKRGMTLVELVVVMSIIAIFVALSFYSFQNSRVGARLDRAQSEVSATIKLAQSYALQGRVQTGEIVCGYGFRFKNDSDYEIYYTGLNSSDYPSGCDSQNGNLNYRRYNNDGYSGSVEEYSLTDGTTSIDSATDIFFTLPHANAYNSGSPFSDTIIKFSNSGQTESVIVNKYGMITET